MNVFILQVNTCVDMMCVSIIRATTGALPIVGDKKVLPRSDGKALSGVSDWVDSTQSLVQINLYQSQIHPDAAMVAGTWLVLEDLSSV